MDAPVTNELEKPYIDARKAAAMLGCSMSEVVDDIERGMRGELPSLIGGEAGSQFWFVARWELEGDRLEMHKARFAAIKSVAQSGDVCGK